MITMTRLKRLLRHDVGAAALEFALVVPVLLALVVGITDFALGFSRLMSVTTAAQAGAFYAMNNGFNATNIAAAVTSATGVSGISASPAPSQSCGCPTGSAITATSCNAACTGGTAPGTYVTVNATYSYTTILPYPTLSNPVTLSRTVMVRTQ